MLRCVRTFFPTTLTPHGPRSRTHPLSWQTGLNLRGRSREWRHFSTRSSFPRCSFMSGLECVDIDRGGPPRTSGCIYVKRGDIGHSNGVLVRVWECGSLELCWDMSARVESKRAVMLLSGCYVPCAMTSERQQLLLSFRFHRAVQL